MASRISSIIDKHKEWIKEKDHEILHKAKEARRARVEMKKVKDMMAKQSCVLRRQTEKNVRFRDDVVEQLTAQSLMILL